jgi:hypothetical protein
MDDNDFIESDGINNIDIIDNIKSINNLEYNLTKTAIAILVTLIAFIFLNPYISDVIQSLLPCHISTYRRRWFSFLILILVLFIIYRLILI